MNIKTSVFKQNIFNYFRKTITCAMFFILSSYAFSQSENIYGVDPRAVLNSYVDSVDYLFTRQTDTIFLKNNVLINYKFKPNNRIVKMKFSDSFLTLKLKKDNLCYIIETPSIDYKYEVFFSFKEVKEKLILFKVVVFFNEQKCFVVKNGKTHRFHEFLMPLSNERIKKDLYNHFSKLNTIIP
jgi:hypothetical protein